MTLKLFTAGISFLASAGLIAQADGLGLSIPQTPIGWAAIASTIALTIMVFMDRRKVARADTSEAVLKERDKLIASRDMMISHLEMQIEKLMVEAKKFYSEIETYRKMHHDFRDDVQNRLLNLTVENASMKALLAEKGVILPMKS